MESEVLNYFETQAKSGDWESLYNPQNPKSYPFIIRLQKTLNLLEDIDNKKICDLGCGTGVLIPFILKKNGNYTGIDFSKKMLLWRGFCAFLQKRKLLWLQRACATELPAAVAVNFFLENARFPHHSNFLHDFWSARGQQSFTHP